jgi:beta-lactamase superfamily II metal-dependent hydrolase
MKLLTVKTILLKKHLLLFLLNLYVLSVFAQQQLHIHHINIENGDATLIGIYDEGQQKYTSKILIDGGQSTPDKMLLPYITKMVGSDKESFHFNYVVLTHYHDDHYKGLLALKDGRITADSIIDPGGYKVSTVFKHSAVGGTKPDSLKIADQWISALKAAASHTPDAYVKGRSKMMINFSSGSTSSIGNKIIIGKVGDNDVVLECIAGWGNTLSAGGSIKRNPSPKKSNANNFTLAFMVSCGEFRYFIGGDMGGSSSGSYINQEATVTTYLNDAYPAATSAEGDETVKGHVCGFKANHHGSNNSNTATFMQGMHPAITISSGGNKASWHLPNPAYIGRLGAVTSLSSSSTLPEGTFNRGIYFTNLYDFTSSFMSLTTANTNFANKPGISYDYGNNTATAKASYMIKLTDADALDEKSVFETGRVDITNDVPYQRLGLFFCHKR